VIDDQRPLDRNAATGDDLDAAEPLRRSNRGFWVVATSLVLVCVVMLVAIFANRPLKDTIAHTEFDLNGALARAQRVQSSSGTFSGADAASLAAADDSRTYVGPDEASDGPGTVSVYTSSDVWAAAVQARPDACFFIRQAIGEDTTYAVATGECTGRAALAAQEDQW
jgi:hypothetical protein